MEKNKPEGNRMWKTVWCRSFQAVLKIGNYFMGYRTPATLEGPGKVREVGALLKERGLNDILVVTGSVPPGVPADIYAEAIRLAKASGVTTILDADGELLREGIKAKPDMIKPNIGELRRLLGRTIETEEEIIGAAMELVEVGIPYVCVSVGADGAYLVCGDGVYFTKGAEITVRGVQGAGDSHEV
jgi:fructose-1-phosphate kinase PfkB-like protein